MPAVSIEYNFASAVYIDFHGCATEVNAASDYAGGGLLDGAHHGATLVIDAVNPDGTMDGKLYERLEKVFAETKTYEPYFGNDAEAVEDVRVYNTFNSRFNKRGEAYNNQCGNGRVLRRRLHDAVLYGTECEACGESIPALYGYGEKQAGTDGDHTARKRRNDRLYLRKRNDNFPNERTAYIRFVRNSLLSLCESKLRVTWKLSVIVAFGDKKDKQKGSKRRFGPFLTISVCVVRSCRLTVCFAESCR